MRILSSLVIAALLVAGGAAGINYAVSKTGHAPAVEPLRPVTLSSYYPKLIAYWEERWAQDPFNFIAAKKAAAARLGFARATGDESQFQIAEALLEKARLVTPKGDHSTELALARARMGTHRFREALELADRYLKDHPNDIALLELRADAAMGLGDYERAFADYQTLFERSDGHFSGYVRMADVLELQGRPDEALAYLRQAVRRYESDRPEPRAWLRLRIGIVHLKLGRLAEAEQAFRESLALSPDYYLAMEHLAEVYELQKEPEKARPYLESAIAINRDPGLLERLAAIEEEAGLSAAADALRAEAFEMVRRRGEDPSRAHVRDLAEALLDRQSELPAALALALEDLQLRPGDLRAHYVAARAYRLNKEPNKALEHIRQALRLKTKDADFYLEAAAIEEALGNTEAAAAFRKQASAINPYA